VLSDPDLVKVAVEVTLVPAPEISLDKFIVAVVAILSIVYMQI
jgi:hypothetical protein